MAVAFAVTLIGLSLPARAGLTLTLTDMGTGTTETIDLTGAFSGTGPSTTILVPPLNSPGTITYLPTGGFGNFTAVSITVSTTAPGINGVGQLESIQADARNGSAGTDTLKLTVSGDGFFIGSAGGGGTLTNTLASSNLGTVTSDTSSYQSFIGTGLGGTFVATDSSSVAMLTGPVPITGASSGSSKGVTIPAVPFSLGSMLIVTLDAGQRAQVTGTTSITAVPEPATIVAAIVGVCLPLAGTVLKSRRRRLQA